MTDLVLFVAAIVALLLFMRWRSRIATQKLLACPMPEMDLGLPHHPDGILLLFHHPRCGPCRPAVKQFKQLANIAPGRVLQINVGESLELARSFRIRVTPTILYIKNNAVNEAFIGATSFEKLQALLKIAA